MRRWAVQAAQFLSVLWAAVFLTVCLLHPLTHEPLQAHESDCLVCVLQKTPAPEPLTALPTLCVCALAWDNLQPLLIPEIPLPQGALACLPRIPRAPPR
ncbi:MAG: hypothetical protein P3X24_003820 [bacterium]|nr:hypothetical protein [bacterium]